VTSESEQGAKSWHFVGIGGIGMSAIARILLARGQCVSGSDVKETPLIARLREEGAQVTVGHDAANVDCAHTVIVSSAIDRNNPEYIAAQRRSIPLLHRGEMLAELLRSRSGIAICGTLTARSAPTPMTAARRTS
jgi:UDP-N-acetylmuramate--alanine ligase